MKKYTAKRWRLAKNILRLLTRGNEKNKSNSWNQKNRKIKSRVPGASKRALYYSDLNFHTFNWDRFRYHNTHLHTYIAKLSFIGIDFECN